MTEKKSAKSQVFIFLQNIILLKSVKLHNPATGIITVEKRRFQTMNRMKANDGADGNSIGGLCILF